MVRLMIVISLLREAYLKTTQTHHEAMVYQLPVIVIKIIAVAEVLAAISLLTGMLFSITLIALMLLFMSAIVIQSIKIKKQYWAVKGGWEYDLIMLIFCFVLLAFGPGTLVFVNG